MRLRGLLNAAAVFSVAWQIGGAGAASSKKFHKMIDIDDVQFEELTTVPRSSNVLVLLNARSPQFKCRMCAEYLPTYKLAGESWQHAYPDDQNLVLTELDYSNGQKTFMQLQLNSAPQILFYPNGTGNSIDFDLGIYGTEANALLSFLSEQLGKPVPPIVAKPNYTAMVIGLVLFISVLTIIRVAWNWIKKILTNKTIWTVFTLFLVLMFTSGHMYNRIRGVPYVIPNGQGGISYIAGGFQNQFGLESQIIACIYGVLALASIQLTFRVPRLLHPGQQIFLAVTWTGIIWVVFSILIKIFHIKNGGYPYKLLF